VRINGGKHGNESKGRNIQLSEKEEGNETQGGIPSGKKRK